MINDSAGTVKVTSARGSTARYVSSHLASLTATSSRTATMDPVARLMPRSHICARLLPTGAFTNSAPVRSTVEARLGSSSLETTMNWAATLCEARRSAWAACWEVIAEPEQTTTTESEAQFPALELAGLRCLPFTLRIEGPAGVFRREAPASAAG